MLSKYDNQMITNKTSIWRFFSNFFVAIDQLGNAAAGGNPDNTISARVGYYNEHFYQENKVPWYWSTFQKIINTTFYPVDGPGHCHEAYHNDPGEIFDNRITNFFIAIAATFIIIPSCVLIALLLYLLYALRIVKQKQIDRGKNLEKRLDSCLFITKSTLEELEEHGTNFPREEAKMKIIELKNRIRQIGNVIS